MYVHGYICRYVVAVEEQHTIPICRYIDVGTLLIGIPYAVRKQKNGRFTYSHSSKNIPNSRVGRKTLDTSREYYLVWLQPD